jgi:hypothetical protein
MSIWNDCEEFDAYPFYGFPVILRLESNLIVFEFPKGYEPNGSQTDKVAKRLINFCGEESTENVINDKIIKIKLSSEKLSYLIYEMYLNKY